MDAHDLELEGADDATLAIHRRLVEQNHESQETRKEILAVYRDTWTEFYQWEPAWCDSRLKELAPAYPRFTAPIILPRAEESDDMIADDDPLSFSVTDYDGKDEMTLTCTEECIPASRIVPHPKYEACTPSMRAIKADKSLGNIATFIPYADEGFDQRGYLAQFRETAWQNRWTDNDSHLIMLEAVKLLVSEHSYTYEKIDSLREKIFLPVKSHNGLLWKMKQRDLLQWKTDADVLPPPPPVETNFLFDWMMEGQINVLYLIFAAILDHAISKQIAYVLNFGCIADQVVDVMINLLEVKSGIHGLGTFACSYLAENTAIGEYIAENIEKIYVTEDAARHRKLNYTFDLNMKQILDAATVGNETRYINHATGSKANVYARALYVNGEHRIIFYTAKKVKRGQELFFDYGKKFWGNTATTQSDAEAESD
ncbi:uncharacterized protein FIBRA_03393 [Fibroporia radiculosa]|uniref:SET domain-containing protein n=1 Tax=Fibroporia radiculosa TaxID=599839 RepID=J4G5B5_9APHY|nr:uncharacterized protein FIBRA_03393 [Fibroporia radiculosa]CCM01343.1 predicted protein [Fibroporia radiculosa]